MAEPKTINYAGGQKIYNAEKVDQEIDTKVAAAVDPLSERLDAEIARAKAAEGDLATLDTTDKSNLVAAINELKQSAFTVEPTVIAGSTNPVESSGVKAYVDAQDEATLDTAKDYTDSRIGEFEDGDGSTVVELTGHLDDLETPAESLVTAINNLDSKYKAPDTEMSDTSENAVQNKVIKAYIDNKDSVPTKDSKKTVMSGGTWDAIRFASVKVGETMYWYNHEEEMERRVVHSDNPFTFTFKGQEISVVPADGFVDICVLSDLPDGWHALDGKAELLASEHPDLAAFMPDNVTADGKIWLPYVQHKIIKVKY